MTDNWLELFLRDAVRKKLCTKIHCTTCGAMEFRQGILTALQMAASLPRRPTFDKISRTEIARALAEVRPKDGSSSEMDEAVRCLLFDLWTWVPTLDSNLESA